MEDERRAGGWNTAMILGVVLAVVVLIWGGLSLAMPKEEPVARSYNTACYRALGGDKWICASGGEMEFQSGATLDVQSGATLSMAGTLTSLETSGTLTADDVVVTDTLTVGGAATLNDAVEVTGTLTAEDIVITDTLTVGSGGIVLENDETIGNGTDGVVQIGGFLAISAGDVVTVAFGTTITPLASYQPITSSAAITNAVIADGSVIGQIVVIVNHAADDIVILESGSNLDAGGDITLTGGAYDAVTLMWDSARWVRISFEDN